MDMSSTALNYTNYLALDKILQAQFPKSSGPEHDEMLFIVIHQVYELWFKQILHELDYAKRLLYANDQPRTQHTLRRVLTILKTVVSQIDILETMTPLEFSSFRSYLESASGFQSVQFREIEFVLGHKRPSILNHFPEEITDVERLQRRYHEPTLWDAFLACLDTNGFDVPANQLQRDVTQALASSPEVQSILIDIYQNDAMLAQVCERLVDLDEGLQEWRYRHVKMVERTIGTKMGTGGSPGAMYLRQTLKPLFPDLWSIRASL